MTESTAMEMRDALNAQTEAIDRQTAVQQELLKAVQLIAQLLLEANER